LLTPEHRAANEALTTAIQQVLNAYGWSKDLVLGDFVVIGAQTGYSDDGEVINNYFQLLRDGEMPHHHILGLLRGSLDHYASHDHDEE
jgi:hypothetical protein